MLQKPCLISEDKAKFSFFLKKAKTVLKWRSELRFDAIYFGFPFLCFFLILSFDFEILIRLCYDILISSDLFIEIIVIRFSFRRELRRWRRKWDGLSALHPVVSPPDSTM